VTEGGEKMVRAVQVRVNDAARLEEVLEVGLYNLNPFDP
jgi:hypothetical protein